jgi:hypothetical protein
VAPQTYFDQIQQLYIAYYGRPADISGLSFWAAQLQANNGNLSSIVDAFANSAESTALYGANQAPADLVTAIYQNILHRTPDAGGLAFYTQALADGTISAGNLALAVLYGVQNEDIATVQNELAVANQFTGNVTTYSGDAAAAIGRTFLSQVTSDPSSQAALLAHLTAYGNAASAATTNPSQFDGAISSGVLTDPTIIDQYANGTTPSTGGDSGSGTPPANTFTVTLADGALAVGGTATGDIAVTLASDGAITFVRDGVTASATINIADITSAGDQTFVLSANVNGLSVTAYEAMQNAGFTLDYNGHTISVTPVSTSLTDYSAAAAAIEGNPDASVAFAVAHPGASLTFDVATYHGNASYVAALENAGYGIAVTPASTSLSDYTAAVAAIGEDLNATVVYAAPAEPTTMTFDVADYSANHGYAVALEHAGYSIALTPASTSAVDFIAAVAAIAGDTNVSVAYATVEPSALTVTEADYAGNTGYAQALESAGYHLTVTPNSTSLIDFMAATSAVTNDDSATVAYAQVDEGTSVSFSVATYAENSPYVTALESAGYAIVVNPASTSLSDYSAARQAIDGDASASVAYANEATAVTMSVSDYDTTGYVHALEDAGHSVVVNPASTSLGDYNAALQLIDGDVSASVAYANEATTVTMSVSDYNSTTEYVHALEDAGHGIVVNPESTSLIDYNAAVDAIGIDRAASVSYGSEATTVTMSVSDYGTAEYVSALEHAGHSIVVNPLSTSLDDYSAAVHAIDGDNSASVSYANDASAVTMSVSDYGTPEYVSALENAGHSIVVNPASTSLNDYDVAIQAIGTDSSATVAFAAASNGQTITLDESSYSVANANYVSALETAGYGISVDVTDGNYAAPAALSLDHSVTFNLGDNVSSVDLSQAAGTTGITVDATQDTQQVSITLTGLHSEVDTLNFGSGASTTDTYNVVQNFNATGSGDVLSFGGDTVSLVTTGNFANNGITATASDGIVTFTNTADSNGLTFAATSDVDGAHTISVADAINVISGLATSTGQTVAFTDGTNTYVVEHASGGNHLNVVELVGVVGSAIDGSGHIIAGV